MDENLLETVYSCKLVTIALEIEHYIANVFFFLLFNLEFF